MAGRLREWLWSQWDTRRPQVVGCAGGLTLCSVLVVFLLTGQGNPGNDASSQLATTTSTSQGTSDSSSPSSTSDTTPLGTLAHLSLPSFNVQSSPGAHSQGSSSQLTVGPSGSVSDAKVQSESIVRGRSVALSTVLTCVDPRAPRDASEGYWVHVTVTQGVGAAYGETTGLCHNYAQRQSTITLGVKRGFLTQGVATVEAQASNGGGDVTSSFGPVHINLVCPPKRC